MFPSTLTQVGSAFAEHIEHAQFLGNGSAARRLRIARLLSSILSQSSVTATPYCFHRPSDHFEGGNGQFA